jgi:CheY-like chemotaxis protein
MISPVIEKNLRVIVIDDNRSIHEDFRKILTGSAGLGRAEEMENALFGQTADASRAVAFEVDSAYQGQEGFEMVKRARDESRPYAMAFMDVRMPPGWDGIETTARIWAIDPDLQVVICTAYSDYSWSEMIERLGYSDKLLILKKPFDNIEALQLASALTEKWHLSQRAGLQMAVLERLVEERTLKLTKANSALTDALANVKELTGLVPICGHCKKVRDDHDFWTTVEKYITDRTKAKFTHSLCPACLEKQLREIDAMPSEHISTKSIVEPETGSSSIPKLPYKAEAVTPEKLHD